MKRYPNPWFVVPVLAAAAAGALIGRNFARVSCVSTEADGPSGDCLGREIAFGIAGGIIAFIGVAVVAVLVIRSLREWREYQAGDRGQPSAGCEAPPGDAEEAP